VLLSLPKEGLVFPFGRPWAPEPHLPTFGLEVVLLLLSRLGPGPCPGRLGRTGGLGVDARGFPKTTGIPLGVAAPTAAAPVELERACPRLTGGLALLLLLPLLLPVRREMGGGGRDPPEEEPPEEKEPPPPPPEEEEEEEPTRPAVEGEGALNPIIVRAAFGTGRGGRAFVATGIPS
jgi:hypothetical protein